MRASGHPLDRQGEIPDICTSGEVREVHQLTESLTKEPKRPHTDAESVAARDTCPASERESDLDLAVARAVLKDPDVYRRAIR